MRVKFVYTLYPDLKLAREDLKEKIKKVDFEPSLGIFFLTENLIGYYQEFSKLLDCNSICMPIEGYVTQKAIWTRGALLLLIDADYKLYKFNGPADRVCRDLENSKKGKTSFLIYPAFYFGGRLELLNALLKEKRLYGSYRRGDKTALKRASDFLQEKMVYPINKILRPLRDRGEEAISFNIFPLEISFGQPMITMNGQKIGRSLIRIRFNEKIKIHYTDTLPERGNSLEETVEILKNELGVAKEIEVEKKGIALGHVEGFKVVDFVKRERKISELDKDIINDIDKKKVLGASPYILWFFSRETFGAAGLGIAEYPLGIYPSLYELEPFDSRALFSPTETVKGGIQRLLDYFETVGEFDFLAIDQNFMLMYREKISEIRRILSEDACGIFTSNPSCTLNYGGNIRLMTEVERNIYLNLTRTVAYLKFS